ncbi:SRPBCC family protein [Psychroflexus sp. ALD_RP9]|uniref:SRPBCC family protein n=1 Tax=Psychroflexus sp. ALD_RP9 TaxID=2777186 RepID=UPI001A8C4378|nr:SRPBCC family protein [Psychroflexus sp. ALD_RP9]QSS97454.1 SRPBCC family protein [Psychroflexus sp. ALD_RP9]
MSLHEIKQSIKLPISKKEAWAFLSNPKNLQKIMPDDMGFQIISGLNKQTYPGQIIQYKVTPFKGYTTKWVTEITQVQEPDYFVDIQLLGPYKLWHHKHFIKEIKNGVEITDVVHYQVPFGFIGELLRPILIKPKLKQIFNQRTSKMHAIFGAYKN